MRAAILFTVMLCVHLLTTDCGEKLSTQAQRAVKRSESNNTLTEVSAGYKEVPSHCQLTLLAAKCHPML